MNFHEVWLLDETGQMSLVESGMNGGTASISGTTIHVLAHHPFPNDPQGNGNYDLTRYRAGQAPQTVTVYTNVPNGIFPVLLTTVEGAALIDSNEGSRVVPSRSMTPMVSTIGGLWGANREGRTLVFAGMPAGSGALYLYSEVNGAPQFTMLDAFGGSMFGLPIDIPGSTRWFAYENQTTGCHLGRVTATLELETIPCGDANIHVVGPRADGAIVVGDGANMFALTTTTAQRLGAGSYDLPFFDTSFSPAVLVGWGGHDGIDNLFSCLAMQPDRCWRYTPTQVFQFRTTADATANGGMGAFQHVFTQLPAIHEAKVTIVRSIGPGTFTP